MKDILVLWFHSGWAPIDTLVTPMSAAASIFQMLTNKRFSVCKRNMENSHDLSILIIANDHYLSQPRLKPATIISKARQSNITRYSSEFNTAVSSTWVSWGYLKKPNQSAELLRARTAAQHTDQQTPPAYWCHIFRWPVTTGAQHNRNYTLFALIHLCWVFMPSLLLIIEA